jgi:hypothetical protein
MFVSVSVNVHIILACQTQKERTALEFAAGGGHTESVRLLLGDGADVCQNHVRFIIIQFLVYDIHVSIRLY